jgi:hypothetical protein
VKNPRFTNNSQLVKSLLTPTIGCALVCSRVRGTDLVLSC